MLVTNYQGIFIPPVPPKQAAGRMNEGTVVKRQKFLDKFIKAVMRNPLFRSSNELVVFLKEENSTQFQKYKKASKKVKKGEKVSQILSL